jgi:hypothetical protein
MPTVNRYPYSVTAHATATIVDHYGLVRQIDPLVAESPDLWALEDGTYYDGWEYLPGTGYESENGGVYLDDDPESMLSLALELAPLRANGFAIDAWDSTFSAVGTTNTDGAAPRYRVESTIDECDVDEPRRAARWLGALAGVSPTIIRARVLVHLLETLAGVEVDIDQLIAEREHLPPGVLLDAPEAEISLDPGVPLSEFELPPLDERVIVTDGGRDQDLDQDHRLVSPPKGYPADRSGRRPLRLDGATARRLVHFMHPIPISRGFLMAWVIDNAPGWDGNGLIAAIGSAGLIDQPRGVGMPRLVDGVRWVDIEPSGIASRVELDPDAFRRSSDDARRGTEGDTT